MIAVLKLPKMPLIKSYIWTEESLDLKSLKELLIWILDTYKELLINGSGILKFLSYVGDQLTELWEHLTTIDLLRDPP
jgi:hypothetical protein